MIVPLLWILVNFFSLSHSADNIVLILADDLDIFLDGMVNMQATKECSESMKHI